LKVVAPSSPRDVIGLLAASVRDPDPVIFLEHKSLYATKGEVPDGEIVDTLGTAKIVRPGKDATIVALALMVPRALAAAEKLKAQPRNGWASHRGPPAGPARHPAFSRRGGAPAWVVPRRENPAAGRRGRGDRPHPPRRGFLPPRRPAGAHHHAAYPAAGRR